MFQIKRIKIADLQFKQWKGISYIVIIINRTRKGYKDKKCG